TFPKGASRAGPACNPSAGGASLSDKIEQRYDARGPCRVRIIRGTFVPVHPNESFARTSRSDDGHRGPERSAGGLIVRIRNVRVGGIQGGLIGAAILASSSISTIPARADYPQIRLNTDDTTQLQNEQQIVVDKTNPDNLVACWRDFRLGYRQVGVGYSFDGGD